MSSTVPVSSAVSSSWLLGVAKFVSALPPEQKQTFRAPASAEDCLLLVQQARVRNRKLDRFAEVLRPLIEPLKRFEASIDVLVQTYSSVASPVWGLIRVVIILVNDRISTLNSVANLLQRLVAPLTRFKNYEAIFENNYHLRDAIGSLYCDLIEFCTRVVSHHCSKNVFRKFGSFDKDVSEIYERIQLHWSEVDVTANAANLTEAKAARQAEALSKALQLRKDINRWLSPSSVEDDLSRLLSTYMEGSCDWIVETEDFKALTSSAEPLALRISGHPGGGKSTAAAFLVSHIARTMKENVLLFFCRSTDAEKTFALHILRTLIWQLLQLDDSLYQHLLPAFYRSGRQTVDSESEAFALLNLLLKETKKTPIFIVLDAVDECHDAHTLLPLLLDQATTSTACLKVILSGRDDPGLSSIFERCHRKIFLQANTASVANYVEYRVSNLELPVSKTMRLEIIQKVANASAGLWLFTRLLLDEMHLAPTLDEMQRQLEDIPDGLAQLYSSLLTSKEAKFTKSQIRMAQQLFLWIDTSEYIPAWLWKDTYGDSLEDAMITNIFKFAMRSNSDIFKPMKIVQDIAAPLIHTRLLHSDFIVSYSDGSLSDSTMFVSEFFHQTARQYLSWLDEQPLHKLPTSLRPRRLGALHRGVCASWYFSKSRDFNYSLQHLRERPRSGHFECYLEMCSGLWHCMKLRSLRRDLSTEELLEAEDLCQQLCSFLSSDRCLSFVETSIILHFSQPSKMLLDNIEDSQRASLADDLPESTSAFFRRFLIACQAFVGDLAFAIASRWPSSFIEGTQHIAHNLSDKPEGFDSRPLAKKIDALAHRYQWLLNDPKSRSSDCFFLSGAG